MYYVLIFIILGISRIIILKLIILYINLNLKSMKIFYITLIYTTNEFVLTHRFPHPTG